MANNELAPLVNQFQHESHRKRASEALQSLKKIASIVKPIMRQRNWLVGTLCEFYPPETNLLGLNINRGQKICLRLRYPGDENQFLPLEQVVDTMLHELSHIVHGPHDQHFNALWDQLREEHEALLRKGYTGEGFLGQGNRLGGGRLPMHEARRIARINAEKRRTLTAGSGQKLGGKGVPRGQDPRAIFVAAIERRNAINKGCASGTDKGRQIAQAQDSDMEKEGVTTTKAGLENADEETVMAAIIELLQEEEKQKYGDSYQPPSQENPEGPRATAKPPVFSPSSLKVQQAQIEESIKKDTAPPPPPLDRLPSSVRQEAKKPPSKPTPKPEEVPDTWTCDICTLVNPIFFLNCDACGIERPEKYSRQSRLPTRPPNAFNTGKRETPNALKPRLSAAEAIAKFNEQEAYKRSQPLGWTCTQCSNFMPSDWWSCSVCGKVKDRS